MYLLVSDSSHSLISDDMVVCMAEAWCSILSIGGWIATVGKFTCHEITSMHNYCSYYYFGVPVRGLGHNVWFYNKLLISACM